MEKFPKFIIEDGKLILMKVVYHKDIVKDKTKVRGGGSFRYLPETNTFVFSGSSYDFGTAKFEDIKSCVESGNVYSDNRIYRNITSKHNFVFDTGTELIELKTIVI